MVLAAITFNPDKNELIFDSVIEPGEVKKIYKLILRKAKYAIEHGKSYRLKVIRGYDLKGFIKSFPTDVVPPKSATVTFKRYKNVRDLTTLSRMIFHKMEAIGIGGGFPPNAARKSHKRLARLKSRGELDPY